jgi:hypothetical protein
VLRTFERHLIVLEVVLFVGLSKALKRFSKDLSKAFNRPLKGLC